MKLSRKFNIFMHLILFFIVLPVFSFLLTKSIVGVILIMGLFAGFYFLMKSKKYSKLLKEKHNWLLIRSMIFTFIFLIIVSVFRGFTITQFIINLIVLEIIIVLLFHYAPKYTHKASWLTVKGLIGLLFIITGIAFSIVIFVGYFYGKVPLFSIASIVIFCILGIGFALVYHNYRSRKRV